MVCCGESETEAVAVPEAYLVGPGGCGSWWLSCAGTSTCLVLVLYLSHIYTGFDDQFWYLTTINIYLVEYASGARTIGYNDDIISTSLVALIIGLVLLLNNLHHNLMSWSPRWK